jgi:hypothetical protein
MVRGVLLSKRLAALARQAKIEQVKLSTEDRAQIVSLQKRFPWLRDTLDVAAAYRIRKAGAWLTRIDLATQTPEPVVVLIEPQPKGGTWNLIQWAEDGTAVGGFSLLGLAE